MDPANEQQAPEATEVPAVEENENASLSEILETAFDQAAEAEASEEVTEEVEPPAVEATGEETPEVEATGDEEAPEYDAAPPERWPAELKEAYNGMAPEHREIFMERLYKPMQRSHTEATQHLAEQRKKLDPVMQAYEENKSAFDRIGVTDPGAMIRQQVAWAAHFARVGPEKGLADMQQALGVGQGQSNGQAQDEYLTPVERQLKERLETLEQTTAQVNSSQQQREQQMAEAQRQERVGGAFNALKTFAEAKTPDGQPMHPQIETVAPQMSRLIQSGMVNRTDEFGQAIPYDQQLGHAYEMACRMNNLAPAPATTSPEQVAKVAAASRNVTSKNAASAVPVDRPIGDDISDLYDRMATGRR